MGEGGYTAADALAALAIVGMAVTGLAAGMRVIGNAQLASTRVLADAARMREGANQLDRLMTGRGPFRSDEPQTFTGDPTRFSFPCGGGRVCGATLEPEALVLQRPDGSVVRQPLPRAAAPRFAYASSEETTLVWPPPQRPPPAPNRQVLAAVRVVDQSGGVAFPLMSAPVFVEQDPACEWDAVAQDCRRTAP